MSEPGINPRRSKQIQRARNQAESKPRELSVRKDAQHTGNREDAEHSFQYTGKGKTKTGEGGAG